MDAQNKDSKNSEKSDTSSQIIIISKPPKSCDEIPLLIDDIDTSDNNSPIRDSRHLGRQQTLPFLMQTPIIPNAPAKNASEGGEVYQESILPRINSTPNLMSCTRTPSSSFHSAIRLPMTWLTPQSGVEMKHDSDIGNNLTSLLTSEEQNGAKPEPVNQFGNTLPAVESSGVSGLVTRLTSLLSSRTLGLLDEEVLNNFNLEVGTVASRVDMWRQRLEDEKTNSVRSHSSSADIGSSARSAPMIQAQSFITDDIRHLIQLTRDLTNSLFGRFSWGLPEIEGRLSVLLERGSHIVLPLAEILIMNIWRMLRLILDLHQDDTEKSGVHSVAEAINNAFSAMISLIHLGKAYKNAHESSDSEYTAEDSISLLASSFANLDMKP